MAGESTSRSSLFLCQIRRTIGVKPSRTLDTSLSELMHSANCVYMRMKDGMSSDDNISFSNDDTYVIDDTPVMSASSSIAAGTNTCARRGIIWCVNSGVSSKFDPSLLLIIVLLHDETNEMYT